MAYGEKVWSGLENFLKNGKDIGKKAIKTTYPFLLGGAVAFSACKKEDDFNPDKNNNPGGGNGGNDPEQVDSTQKKHFSGEVQKGPFTGGVAKIFNLPDSVNLRYNGNFHKANIQGDGFYELSPNVTTFVRSEATGPYFNEVEGKIGNPITLEGVTKTTNDTVEINTNVATHAEFSRIADLIKSNNFEDSKQQSTYDLFNFFEIDTAGLNGNYRPEKFDLTAQGHGNAALLTMSSIFQGHRNADELENILNEFRNDFEDGSISNDLGNKLKTSAMYLEHPTKGLDYIANNLTNQNSNWNPDTTYKRKIDSFINQSPYSFNDSALYESSDEITLHSLSGKRKFPNLLKKVIGENVDTINMEGAGGYVGQIGLGAYLPAGETLDVEITDTVKSSKINARPNLYVHNSNDGEWEKSGNMKYSASPEFGGRSNAILELAGYKYATLKITSSQLSSPQKTVIKLD